MRAHMILQLVTSPRGAMYFLHANCEIWSKPNLLTRKDVFHAIIIDTSTIYSWMASVAMHPKGILVPSSAHFTSKNSLSGEFGLYVR